MLDRSLYTRHRRPTRLSDPSHDFAASELAELLSTPDDRMTRRHFAMLLGPHLPAGAYAEVAYFFPRAVDHVLAHPEDALDLMTPIVGFASTSGASLERDRLLGAARDALRTMLWKLVATFEVIHFDVDACAAKGWRLAYVDNVVRLEALCQGTTDLVRFGTHADLAVEFVDALAHSEDDATRAAWFLAYARSVGDVYAPPDHPPIRALLSDRTLLEAAAVRVRSQVAPHETSPTYWQDTFAALALASQPDA